MSNKLVRNFLIAAPLALAVGVSQAAEGLSLTPMFGFQTYDNQLENDEVYGIGIGYHFGNGFAAELAGHWGGAGINDVGVRAAGDKCVSRFTNCDGEDTGYVDTAQYRLEAQYWLPTDGFMKPYVSYALGNVSYTAIKVGDNSNGTLPAETDDGSFIANIFGAGVGFEMAEDFMLRTDFRYLQYDMHHGVNEIDDFQYGLGLSWLPYNTVEEVVVEPTPVDSDLDGVFDDADQCPGTAPGLVVDAAGCPIDTDLDGVFDGADQCPNSAAGVTVDAVGCEVVVAPVILDTDGDGVLDDVDLCPNTFPGVAVDASGCDLPKVLEEQTVSKNLAVYFESGSAALTPESYGEVAALADFMNEYPTTEVVVEGHTDSQGAAAFNQNLSQQRADAVAYALTSQYGIDYSRVSSVGYGEEYPIADNSTRDGRALNRRVVAVINETVTIGE